MTRLENAIETISEECAEITYAVSKALRFGLNDHPPYKEDTTNADEIMLEFLQLQALIEALQEKKILPTYPDEVVKAIKEEKLQKMAKYQEYSKQHGFIKED